MIEKAALANEPKDRPLWVVCGIAHLAELTRNQLSSLKFRIDPNASIKLVLDFPSSYAWQTLNKLRSKRGRLIVVTWNSCQEHVEDLWDLGPSALLEGTILEKQNLRETLLDVMNQVSDGKRYRLTPGPSTLLTRQERLVLQCIAQGWNNKLVGKSLHLEEQSVKNILRSVYKKLTVNNHVQAALYYWGLWHELEPNRGSLSSAIEYATSQQTTQGISGQHYY
jgi:DNA-binding NarL/FixJ family response regulator